jgi:outer membrane protein
MRFLLAVGACLVAAPVAAQTIDDGKTDTLKEALAQAYHSNPTIEGARANQRATDENVPIERADLLPNLTSTATFSEFL